MNAPSEQMNHSVYPPGQSPVLSELTVWGGGWGVSGRGAGAVTEAEAKTWLIF